MFSKLTANRIQVTETAPKLKSLIALCFRGGSLCASIRVATPVVGGLGACVGLATYRGIYKSLVSASHVAVCKSQPASIVRTRVRSCEKEVQFDWWMLWKYLSPDLFLLILAILSAVLCAVVNIGIPMELGRLINVISGLTGGMELAVYLRELLPVGLRLSVLFGAQGLLTSFYIGLLSVVGERLACRLRASLLDSLLQQDIGFFDDHKTGELVSRLSADVQDLKSSFKLVISQGLRGTTQLIGCMGSLLYISPLMTLVVGISVPLMVAMGTGLGSILRKLSRRAQEKVAVATGIANEALSNVRTIRAFAMEPSELQLYLMHLSKAKKDNEYLGVGIAIFQGLSNFAINGMVLAVVSNGGYLLARNQISPGQLMSFLLATQTIQKSLGSLSILFSQVVSGLSAGSRVFQYMNVTPSVALTGGLRLPLKCIQGCVTLHKVSFAYSSRPNQNVVDDLSVTLSPGSVTALCGLSGAGKSTVASLLERFYEPTQGSIYLDGHLLSSLDPSWLRGEVIGYISQEPILFSGTVAENIRYGCPAASDEQIVAASTLANAHSFINEFPSGYATIVGERGQALSGGQKQRVAIARAILKDPKILILDEATSALDAQSESLVQDALDRACKGRTVLVIAHRLSTIRNAHQIVVVHKGQLKEVGTHEELMSCGTYYKELIRRQTILN